MMWNKKPRLDFEMTTAEMLTTFSEGNPGAITVLIHLLKNNAAIDPDSMLGHIGAITMLDVLGIYGSQIWLLYKDICHQDLSKMIAVLRAVQLGIVDGQLIIDSVTMSSGQYQATPVGWDPDMVLDEIKTVLPNFMKDPANATY